MEVSDQIKVFQKLYNVPRETINQLTEYHKLLIESQEKTNLVGSGTISSIWTRHFSDSAKLTDRIIYYKNKPKTIDKTLGTIITEKFDKPEIFSAIISSVFFIFKKNQIPANKKIKGSILYIKLGTNNKETYIGTAKLTS